MTRDLLNAYRFHRENSACRVGHHAADALDYARAEIAARNLGMQHSWHYDNDIHYALDGHADWCGNARQALHEGRDEYAYCNHEVVCADLRDADGNMVASLGGIIDADATYRRTVEAELALEALPSPIPASALYSCPGD